MRKHGWKEVGAVDRGMTGDKEFMEDLIDIVVLEQREKEPLRSLYEYLADRRKRTG